MKVGTTIGLPALDQHLPLIALSFVAFFALQFASSSLSPLLFPRSFATFNRKTRLDWDLHFVSRIAPSIRRTLLTPRYATLNARRAGSTP